MKVSIIIPVYNVEEYLDECILSAINQTLDDIEIIAIDDKSTDSSLDILNEYKEKYDFVKVISNERNMGVSITRNIGIHHAKGEYIYFLDSDDYIDLEAMEVCYKKAKENNLDIITFDAEMFRDKEYTGTNFNESYERDKIIKSECISGEDFFSKYYPLGAYRSTLWLNLYKKEFLVKNSLFFYDGIIHEDDLHSFKAFLLAEKVLYIPKKFIKRRMRNNSIMTSSTYKRRIECMEVVLRESYNFYLRNKDYLKPETNQVIMSHIKSTFNVVLIVCDKGNLNKDKIRIIENFKIDNNHKKVIIKDENSHLIKCNNKKNILFVMYALLDGGAEKALMLILDNLDYSKYNVDLIVLAKEQSYLYEINENVNVTYIYDKLEQFYEDYSDGKFNLQIEKKHDVEIAFLNLFTVWIIGKFGNPKAKKIGWLHADGKYIMQRNTVEYVNNLYDRMDEIISVSDGVKQSIIDLLGNKLENKLKTIYIPIDIDQIRYLSLQDIEYKKDKFTILSVGRLVWEKGFERLIRVHKKLMDEGIDNELIILGSGREEENLKKLIKDLGIEDSCKLIEYQKNPYSWIKMSDIFISASHSEALSLVIIEAMILEKPIVATDTNGSRELFKNNLGLMVGNSEEGLYYGLRNMILNKELRELYIKNLKEVDKFDFDKSIVMPQIEKLFEEDKNMISISLCMILKNEEDVIARCLDCVKGIVDEIIIVDTGSTDKTKEIVKNYTDKIYDFEWIDDFAAARNFSFSKATKEYILWIDADEVLFKEDQDKLLKLKESLNSNIDTVTMTDHRGLNENGEPLLRYKRNRLVKRKNNFKWIGFIHEYIEVSGNVYESDIAVTHQKLHDVGDRNLRIYRSKLSEGHTLSTRDVYYYGKELYYNDFHDEAIKVLDPFIDMNAWIEEKIDALCKISSCYLCKNNYEKTREVLYRTFEYTRPRAEAVYRIAYAFEREGRYEEAIDWYESILNLKMPKGCYGFIFPEYWTWKPHLQLTVCYYKLKNIEKAIYHHKKAYEINPNNECISYNEQFFNRQSSGDDK